MKIKITSLGCRLNQSEIESVSTLLQMRGHEITFSNDADIFIINSCAVTQKSERKTRQIIYQAMGFTGENTPRRIIVTGCSGDEIKTDRNITYISNDHKYLIPDIIDENISAEELETDTAARFRFTPPLMSSTSRVNLKIQDGCDNFCSYCIIPFHRGTPVSKPMDQVLTEFQTLLEHGYKEIILTGVNIGKYRHEGEGLPGLLERLLKIKGKYRLHLTSLDPDCTENSLLELFAHEKMVRHLHLSLQSGSNSVLERMNRPYTGEKYLQVADKLKSIDMDFNFTTDVIAGFPGESDSEFRDTLNLIKNVGYSHIHTFRFSPRPGTKAAVMESQIPEIVKTERSKIITDLCHEQKLNYYSRFNNRKSTVLTEKTGKDFTTGHNEYYIPVEIGSELEKNSFHAVNTILDEKNYVLKGTLV